MVQGVSFFDSELFFAFFLLFLSRKAFFDKQDIDR